MMITYYFIWLSKKVSYSESYQYHDIVKYVIYEFSIRNQDLYFVIYESEKAIRLSDFWS